MLNPGRIRHFGNDALCRLNRILLVRFELSESRLCRYRGDGASRL
jgi:hypothetical protein